MITIPVKIKREDKVVMVRCLEALDTYPLDISDLNRVIVYEIYTELLSKLCTSKFNDNPIRLTLVQAQGFMSFVRDVYASIGKYEWANALAIEREINQAIKKKIRKLKR